MYTCFGDQVGAALAGCTRTVELRSIRCSKQATRCRLLPPARVCCSPHARHHRSIRDGVVYQVQHRKLWTATGVLDCRLSHDHLLSSDVGDCDLVCLVPLCKVEVRWGGRCCCCSCSQREQQQHRQQQWSCTPLQGAGHSHLVTKVSFVTRSVAFFTAAEGCCSMVNPGLPSLLLLETAATCRITTTILHISPPH